MSRQRMIPVRSLTEILSDRSSPIPSAGDDTSSLDDYSLMTTPTTSTTSSSPNIETLTERLFSHDHLNLILHDPQLLARFQNFLALYRPRAALSLRKYLDVQKAIAAVQYANALADNLWPGLEAAPLDPTFESKAKSSIEVLLNDALPGYITHRITELVTDLLQREITGQASPAMKQMVSGLAEVYCLTDPSLPDNPIVYASDEFFNATQYDQAFVLGRNCRFLQGSKTSRDAIDRLVDALREGQEICETILNYRQDGSPFLNLLLIAPLYDDKNIIRYFLGAQVDINGLLEGGGRGLDSFAALLARDGASSHSTSRATPTPKNALATLSGLLNEQERDAIHHHHFDGRQQQQRSTGDGTPRGHKHNDATSTPTPSGSNRRMIGLSDQLDGDGSLDALLWPSKHLGPNGRLPGVFQNYFLVRAAPSLRIIFTSPSLRMPGLAQSKFTSRIRGPAHVRRGVLEALAEGESFTAKIAWLADVPSSFRDRVGGKLGGVEEEDVVSERDGGTDDGEDSNHNNGAEGFGKETARARWIHCTPMLGMDRKVGVWMVVFV